MKTISESVNKLNEASQKRGEFSRNLDEYISVHQDSLPQEIITAWGEFELLEKEAKTIEVEAIEEIEKKIKKARLLKKFHVVTSDLSMVQFLLLIGLALYLFFFPDNNLNCPGSPSRSCNEAVFSPVDSATSS